MRPGQAKGPSVGPLSGGGGSPLSGPYWSKIHALLQPDAVEPVLGDIFTYNVGASPKFLLASWNTQINGSGRFEVRDPRQPVILTDCILRGQYMGSMSSSSAILLDPGAYSIPDDAATYYQRLDALYNLPLRCLGAPAAGAHVPLLPGPYGCIIEGVTNFDFAWINILTFKKWGPNLMNEINDSESQRVGNALSYPVSKRNAGELQSSAWSETIGGATPQGSIVFRLLPSNWTFKPDPVSPTYVFRDDFMSVNFSASWTVAQSSAGNVTIDPVYQWARLVGNNDWSTNYIATVDSYLRNSLRSFVVDVFNYRGAVGGSGGLAVGLKASGLPSSVANWRHAVAFGIDGTIQVVENGILLAASFAYTDASIYRVKITTLAIGARYEIQGGPEYPPIDGNVWADITPAGGVSVLDPGNFFIARYGAQPSYASDVRIFA